MRFLNFTFLILTLILQVSASDSTTSVPDTIFAIRLNEQITIDGKLSEVAWLSNRGVSTFIQRDPLEGAKPTFPTIVYILYDDHQSITHQLSSAMR